MRKYTQAGRQCTLLTGLGAPAGRRPLALRLHSDAFRVEPQPDPSPYLLGFRDTVSLPNPLQRSLEIRRGFEGIDGPGDGINASTVDFIAYMARHDPEALIWNIAPPYERNWAFFKLLRRIGPLQHRAIVLTTTDKAKLDSLIAQEPSAHLQVLGKPYQPARIIEAVKRAIDSERGQPPASWANSGKQQGSRVLPGIAETTTTPTLH